MSESIDPSVWQEAAKRLLKTFGFVEARRLSLGWRNDSARGSATRAFHNAVLKEINRQHAMENGNE